MPMHFAKLTNLALRGSVHLTGAIANSVAEKKSKNALAESQAQAPREYPADSKPAAAARGMPQTVKLMGHRINIGPLAKRLNPAKRQMLKDALNFILPDIEPGTNEQGHLLYGSVTKPEGKAAVPLAVQMEVDKQNNLSKLTAHPLVKEGEEEAEPLEAHFEPAGNNGLPAGLGRAQRSPAAAASSAASASESARTDDERPALPPRRNPTANVGTQTPPLPPRRNPTASASTQTPPLPPRNQAPTNANGSPAAEPQQQAGKSNGKTPHNELMARFGIDKHGRRLGLHELKDKLSHMEHDLFEKHFDRLKDLTTGDSQQVKY